jgi:GNAT superfamily N-acetyltransferase
MQFRVTSEVLIRRMSATDTDPLIELTRRTIDKCYRPFLGDVTVDAFVGSGAADHYVQENVERCWVIVLDGQPAGYAVCQDNLIDLMMVDERLHRRGLGTALLHHVEALLFASVGQLTLESFEVNDNANTFYRKNGWLEHRRYFDDAAGVSKIVFCKSSPTVPRAIVATNLPTRGDQQCPKSKLPQSNSVPAASCPSLIACG